MLSPQELAQGEPQRKHASRSAPGCASRHRQARLLDANLQMSPQPIAFQRLLQWTRAAVSLRTNLSLHRSGNLPPLTKMVLLQTASSTASMAICCSRSALTLTHKCWCHSHTPTLSPRSLLSHRFTGGQLQCDFLTSRHVDDPSSRCKRLPVSWMQEANDGAVIAAEGIFHNYCGRPNSRYPSRAMCAWFTVCVTGSSCLKLWECLQAQQWLRIPQLLIRQAIRSEWTPWDVHPKCKNVKHGRACEIDFVDRNEESPHRNHANAAGTSPVRPLQPP